MVVYVCLIFCVAGVLLVFERCVFGFVIGVCSDVGLWLVCVGDCCLAGFAW